MLLKACEEELTGTVKLVFQPSEEKRPGGARLLLPYLMEPPVPQAIFGQHVFPGLPVGTIGIRPGAFLLPLTILYLQLKEQELMRRCPRWVLILFWLLLH